MLKRDQVRHVAKLARLKLSEEEIELFSRQLSDVLGYIDILNEVDVSKVQPTYQVTGLTSVSRSDSVKPCSDPDALLGCSGLPGERRQIKVKKVFG